MAASPPGFSCVVLIPAHNEIRTIRRVVEACLVHAERVQVISDGSNDGTVEALDGLPIEVVEHDRNVGKGLRLVEGIERAAAAGASHVLTMDADGQHDPNDIPAFIEAARHKPAALVLGDRMADRQAMPTGRAASIGFGDFFVSWATGQRLRDAQCGMRVYPTALWSRLALDAAECQHFVFETAVLLHASAAGACFTRVPIAARYGDVVERPSHYRPFRDTWRITVAVTRFILRGWLRPKGLLIALRLLR